MKTLFIVGFVGLLLVAQAMSLGISPSSTEHFMTDLPEYLEFRIYNEKNTAISISVEGELAEVMEVETPLVLFDGESTKVARIKLNVPILSPGPHTAIIKAREVPSGSEVISASVSVVARVSLISPYPGKFLKASIAQTEFLPGKEGNVIVEVINHGQTSVESAFATVGVLDGKKKKASLESEEKPVPSLESSFLVIPWTSTHPGSFLAEAVVEYDGEKTKASRQIKVGVHELKLSGLHVDSYEAGLASLSVSLLNDWNKPLEQGWAEVNLLKDGISIASSPTVITSFNPYEEKKSKAYLDIQGVQYGKYNISVKLHYLGISKEEFIEAVLTADGLLIKGEARPIKGETWIYIISALILALLGFEILHFSRKRFE